MSDFYLSVKSTIDRLAFDIGADLSVGVVELDDTVNVDEALASPDDLIIYHLVSMDENPFDPLWAVAFEIGAKTVSDAANYDMARLISGVRDRVYKGGYIEVKDYSNVAPPTSNEGYIYFSDMNVDPQAFEGASGLRLWTVLGRAVRNID